MDEPQPWDRRSGRLVAVPYGLGIGEHDGEIDS